MNTTLTPERVTSQSFLDVVGVADRWGVHPNFIYTLIANGDLPHLRIGKPGTKRPVLRIPVEALESWEKSQLEKHKGRAA